MKIIGIVIIAAVIAFMALSLIDVLNQTKGKK